MTYATTDTTSLQAQLPYIDILHHSVKVRCDRSKGVAGLNAVHAGRRAGVLH